jgi:hypothetical protein
MNRWQLGAIAALSLAGPGCGESDGGDDQTQGASGSSQAGAAAGGLSGAGGTSAAAGTSGSDAVSGAGSGGGGGRAGGENAGAPSAGTAGGGVPPSAGAGGAPDPGSGSGGEAGTEDAAGAESGEPLVRVATVPADKIDLLFVIDNSISMADKQEIFRDAVPLLVERLVTPACVDAAGEPTGELADDAGACAEGEPEFSPIRDIHIAVITSSLGDGGSGDVCADGEGNDHAHLLPSVRDGLGSWNDSGFLAWDPDQNRHDPPGEGDAQTLVASFQDLVVAAGESGCGYESTLESWYRFLIDPEPPSSVTRDLNTQTTVATYPDETVLAQRAAFLRSDSLVGIVVLSDENDCSIIDSGQGFLVSLQMSGQFHMPRATSVCAEDPNDVCCRSCQSVGVPAGCSPAADDAECQKGANTFAEDHPSLRCFDQKRRFGFDLLFPIQRYVDGLSAVQVRNRAGELVQNPLFAAAPGQLSRDLSRVFVLGIVGVPWQDVADEDSLEAPRALRYLGYQELVEQDRWPLLIGEDGEPPGDALLLETSADRSTLGLPPHPLTGDELAASTETERVNPINGHESAIADGSDLQFSCIFPVNTPRVCEDTGTNGCDCRPNDAQYNRALCDGATQEYAKAYPAGRHLELLRAFGQLSGNSVVASICPKVMESDEPSVDPDYGYNPAVSALVDRMKSSIAPTCLAEPLEPESTGEVDCELLEVTAPMGGSCEPCDGAGREDGSRARVAALREQLASARYCGEPGQPDCDDLCVCGVQQIAGANLSACQNDALVPASLAGFCYVDADQDIGNPELLRDCPVGRKRRLRLLGDMTLHESASSFVICGG